MADPTLSALYQEMILDHYRRPRNKGALEAPDESVDMKNPLCGDEVNVQMSFTGDTISDIKFVGRGCSISQASASLMTELVKGRQIADAAQLRETFRAMVMGDEAAANNAILGKARALSGVAKFPARVKCALLGWNALDEGIHRHEEHAQEHGQKDAKAQVQVQTTHRHTGEE